MTLYCRNCKSKNISNTFIINTYTIQKCISCGFHQVSRKPTEEELRSLYEEEYFSHSKYQDIETQNRENNRRLKLVKKFIPRGKQILEVGCGRGDFMGTAKKNYHLSGFDFSESAIEIAKAEYPDLKKRLWAGSIESQAKKLAPEKYDAICAWDVIEHIWDPVSSFSIIFDALKPEGVLFLSTPNISALTAKVFGKHWAFMTPPEHLSFFGKKSMHLLATETLKSEIAHWSSKGKRANFSFVIRKAKRVAPKFLPDGLVAFLQKKPFNQFSIYVPTGDIQYVAIKKRVINE